MQSRALSIERHFDLRWLRPLQDRLVEPSGVPLETAGQVRRARDALGRALIERDRDFIISAACIQEDPAQVPIAAASPEDLRVFPRRPLALGRLVIGPAPPPLLGAWLDLGAWVCGDPGWNDELDCVQVPVLLPLARMRGRRVRQLLARAA